MFGIGPTELVVILVIALLVFGPKRLLELATSLGKGLAAFRKATAELNSELDDVRRAVEDETRDLTKAAAPGRRVSRGDRVLPTPEAATPLPDSNGAGNDAPTGEAAEAAKTAAPSQGPEGDAARADAPAAPPTSTSPTA